ncbi:Rid family detoxifying hydrolase [Novosphingobium sp. AP12]|uniref:Rid family detoxifying hydrolase n=1 Tax=Novosphingobium sp. AP12 TaxID=1144305 RepID=UPI000271F1A8|nr:Rid family detoxifying hydrolase [Novosphingobium sp. AP12]EJL24215.1 endoribonuclease L-PSP, putative [Novosphingobium sp. AP12]
MKVLSCAAALLLLCATGPSLAKTASGIVETPTAPAAIGPYSQAIDTGTLVFVSGQLGLSPQGTMASGDTAGQSRQALENIKAILAAAGLTMNDVVQTQIYLLDLGDFAAVNDIYAGYFKRAPSRATVQVARLPRDGRIEISAIAVRPERSRH